MNAGYSLIVLGLMVFSAAVYVGMAERRDRRAATPPPAPAPAPGSVVEVAACRHYATVKIDGQSVIQFVSSRGPLGPQHLRGAEIILASHDLTSDEIESIVSQLADQIASSAAAEIDDDLKALDGAA